ncbi:Pr6Pr family membrane protein [Mesorhizobium sp. CC13]|uniref:Pr6Pr family membrane protein n=1 Tax=Mesorhizobium sp. CC13 TaxID=3029194 RepID=UPI0032647D9D
MARWLQIAGLAIGLAGLILQFAITMPASMAAGRSLLGSVVFYFSFFTILTNIGAVLVHLASLRGAGTGLLGRFSSARMRGGVAAAIAMVMIVYVTVLAPLWQPEGLFLVCDVLLHYVTPVIYLLWWLTAGADGSTRWSDIGYWVAYPVIYLVYALARAPIAGEVPYPFLDIAANGAVGVAKSALAMTILFLVLCVIAIVADRGISGFRKAARPN